ncbi:CRE-DHS-20 protein [Aphelenchoides avenae]|nr:CRE-DHS-20 protein [Aphelenchus avenae]
MTAENTRQRIEASFDRLPKDVQEEYGAKYKETMIQELWQGYDSTGSDRLDYVVDAYYHAITARWPRNRYRCGWETIFIHIPITFLPTELEDIALRYLRGSNNVPACLEKN